MAEQYKYWDPEENLVNIDWKLIIDLGYWVILLKHLVNLTWKVRLIMTDSSEGSKLYKLHQEKRLDRTDIKKKKSHHSEHLRGYWFGPPSLYFMYYWVTAVTWQNAATKWWRGEGQILKHHQHKYWLTLLSFAVFTSTLHGTGHQIKNDYNFQVSFHHHVHQTCSQVH